MTPEETDPKKKKSAKLTFEELEAMLQEAEETVERLQRKLEKRKAKAARKAAREAELAAQTAAFPADGAAAELSGSAAQATAHAAEYHDEHEDDHDDDHDDADNPFAGASEEEQHAEIDRLTEHLSSTRVRWAELRGFIEQLMSDLGMSKDEEEGESAEQATPRED